MMNQYAPKVIVAGSTEQFRTKILELNKPARIVGFISFSGKYNGQQYDINSDKTLLINNEIIDISHFKSIADESKFDYIVFVDYFYFKSYAAALVQNSVLHGDRIITLDNFIYKANNGFYSIYNESVLFSILYDIEASTVLDIDSSFSAGNVYVKPDYIHNLKIDTIRSSSSSKLPVFNNVYDHVYDSLNDCRYHHYDAIIFSAERKMEDLSIEIYEMLAQADKFLVFIREDINLDEVSMVFSREPMNGLTTFKEIKCISCVNGNWLLFNKQPFQDTGIYVVTHKKCEVNNLPDDYIIIHAGRKLGKDLGYIGDDTGHSISNLNPYLNEMTAIYWIWKNTSHDYVGISHYRRFFSNKDNKDFIIENILTSEQAREILQSYDIIVAKGEHHLFNTYSYIIGDSGSMITRLAIKLTRNILERHYPDYIDAFDYVIYNTHIFKCNMFITRKYIFDSYCSWLFSFILEAESEYRKFVDIEELDIKQRRVYGFICERMFNVWLMKNDLRIKELNIMKNLSL